MHVGKHRATQMIDPSYFSLPTKSNEWLEIVCVREQTSMWNVVPVYSMQSKNLLLRHIEAYDVHYYYSTFYYHYYYL